MSLTWLYIYRGNICHLLDHVEDRFVLIQPDVVVRNGHRLKNTWSLFTNFSLMYIQKLKLVFAIIFTHAA
jgi:hypothetical protein